MIRNRIRLGTFVARALSRHDMQKLGAAQFPQILERGDERLQIMAIDRPHVIEAKLFKHGRRGHHPLGVLLEAPRDLQDGGRN